MTEALNPVEITDAHVDRGARGLYEALDLSPKEPTWDEMTERQRGSYRDLASAVLAAAHNLPEKP